MQENQQVNQQAYQQPNQQENLQADQQENRREKRNLKSAFTGVLFLAAAAAAALGIVTYLQMPGVRYEAAVSAGSEYASLQQFEEAIAELKGALGLQEDDLEARILLMESYAGEGDYNAMLELLGASADSLSEEDLETLQDEAAQLLESGAQKAAAVGDAELAVTLYEALEELTGESSEAGEAAEEMLTELILGQAVESALDSFEEVLERDPDNLTALEMTAELLYAQGDYEEAIARYARVAELSGDAWETGGDIARCYRAAAADLSGEAAILMWETSLEWDEESEEAYLALADLYLSEDDSQNALLILQEGIECTGSETLQAYYDEINVSAFEQLVISIIDSITTEEMTSDEKLRACYDYIIDTTSYVRTYESPEGDWTKEYAFDVLAKQQGNCFRYAAAFAYMCRELGYEVKVCTGQVSASRGGTTPHGWAVVTIDGVEYLCDPDLEQSLGYDFYMKTYDQYPVKPLITEEEWEIEF